MGFDSGPGIMYRGQALLLCQVIGKLPLTDAELVALKAFVAGLKANKKLD